jgi:hypothetical protein
MGDLAKRRAATPRTNGGSNAGPATASQASFRIRTAIAVDQLEVWGGSTALQATLLRRNEPSVGASLWWFHVAAALTDPVSAWNGGPVRQDGSIAPGSYRPDEAKGKTYTIPGTGYIFD